MNAIPGFIKWGLGLVALGIVTMILASQPSAGGGASYFWFGVVFVLVGIVVLTRPVWRRKLAERSARR